MLPKSESQLSQNCFQLRVSGRNSPLAQRPDSVFEGRTVGHLHQHATRRRMRLYTIFCSRVAYALASTPFKLITQLGDQLHQPATVGLNRRFRGEFLPTLLMGFVAVHAHLQMRQVRAFRFPSVTQARHGSHAGACNPPGRFRHVIPRCDSNSAAEAATP